MAHKLCHAFFLVRSLFTQSFPYGKYGEDHSLYCVKVASGFCRLALHLVLHQIYIKAPVHAFYRPMVTYYCAQSGRVRRQAAYIQPFFRSTHSCRLFDCGRLVFNDCHVSAAFFPVGNYFKTVIYVVGSCLDPPMAKLRSFSI